jgi:tetratricopeptide (TPR) repeat protein
VRSSSANFKQLRHFTAVVMLALVLNACATADSRPAISHAGRQPLATLLVPLPDAGHDVMAQLLAGEMALAHADLKSAATHYATAMAFSNDPDVAERAARLAIAVHDAATAQRAMDRWQALGASAAALAEARAELALDRGDAAEAARQLERLIATGDKDAWRQFGRVLVSARDQAQAAQLLVSLATPQRLPGDPQAWLAMSELGEKFGRHAYAVKIADAAAARFQTAETYAWLAQMKFKDGDHAGARAMLSKALIRAPKNLQLRLAYAAMLSQDGDTAGAAVFLARGPQNADTWALRVALAAQKKDDKALASLYQQMQRAPEDVRDKSAFLLGQLASMQHRDDEALKWYGMVGDDDPHAFDADLRSAALLHEQGKNADAHELLGQLQLDYLEQPAQARQALQLDAELYLQEHQFTLAVQAFTRALQVVPNDPELLYDRGLAYAQAGQIDPAVQDFQHLLKIKPGDVDASNALGFTLADADRDLPEATQLLQVARSAKPNDPAIADSWGWLQYRLGHLDQAAQTLRGAWLALKDADVGVHLGEVLWKQGRHNDAEHVFEQVRKLDPHNSSLQQTLKRLQP